MSRVNPSASQKQRLLKANGFRCCICKGSSIGFNFHHIDEDSSNTVDSNLAVLCLEDHDKHHRPSEYEARPNHLELDATEIRKLKGSWEAFVAEAMKPEPKVLATLSCYGTKNLIHSMQLVMQWPDERIEYTRSFHLLDGDLNRLMDEVLRELASIGPSLKMAVIDQPLPVEHCPCCGSGFSRTMKPAMVARVTNPAWVTDSVCTIYINPEQTSLALVFFLGKEKLFSSRLHLCQRKYLHYSSDGVDERVNVKTKPTVRAQAIQMVEHVLNDWDPANILIGTGDPDAPRLISDLQLPKIWETRATNKITLGEARQAASP